MVAERMQTVGESPTVRLSGLVAEMRAKGEDILSLAIGQPDFDTPAHIVQAAKDALEAGYTRYTPSPGIPELREAIAKKSQVENGIPCGPDDVLVAPTKFALFATVLAHSGEGDEVLLPDPGWVSYAPMARLAGARPVPVPCPPSAAHQMTPEAVAERVTPHTRLLVLNTPNNPTGSVYSRETVQGIADLAADHDFLVVTDEIYEKIIFEGAHHAVASLPGAYDHTITINGFSKTYAMTGWRLGWVVAPPPLLAPINTVQQQSLTCATAFAQKGAVAAFTGPAAPVEQMVAAYGRRREVLVDRLRAIPGLHGEAPAGTFYVWARLEDGQDSVAFAERLLTEARVAVTPGRAFGEAGEGHVRLSFATSRETLERALRRMGEVLT